MTRRTVRVRRAAAVMWAGAMICLGGCHHRKVQPIVLPQATPVQLDSTAATGDLPDVEAPNPKLPPVPVAEAAATPKQKKKRPSKPQSTVASAATTPATGATQGAAVSATPAGPSAQPEPPPQPPQVSELNPGPVSSVIGELTPGGGQNPKAQQEASDLIAANEKRLNAVPADVAKAKWSLLSKVRNFQKQATQALKAGDAEGAKTLATKGKLLLDDLNETPGE